MTKSNSRSSAARLHTAKETGFDIAVSAYPAIVAALVKQAEQGSCPHAKLVFELLTPKPAADGEEETDSGPSLAEMLLERLQLRDPDAPSEGQSPESAGA